MRRWWEESIGTFPGFACVRYAVIQNLYTLPMFHADLIPAARASLPPSRRHACWWLGLLFACLLTMAAGTVQAAAVRLTAVPAGSLGAQASFWVEEGAALSLAQAQALQRAGRFQASPQAVPSFGIGARPVWVHLELFNPTDQALAMHLLAGVTWIDQIDVFVVQAERIASQRRAGDERPAGNGLAPAIGHVLPLAFAPGRSDLFLRVASVDPMVLPIELMSPERFGERQRLMSYGYGFLYGFLAALCAYNLLLFAGLGERRYLYYSLFLISLIAMNLAYTGHGLAWLWPGEMLFQRYVILVLMMLFGASGLLFASRFLALAEHAPRALQVVRWFCGLGAGAMALCLLAGSHQGAAIVAFSFVSLFTLGMLWLGALAVRNGREVGRYFLAAALCGALGTATTTLAVLGWLPFTAGTYHAVEVGIIVEATLLALALAYQMRYHQRISRHAERLARLDPLTELHNRRAFLELAGMTWSSAERGGRPLSLIMMDIDHFKQINDQHGHEAGDQALVEIARLLERQKRTGDILARWGGEEFILLLPETDLEHAAAFAERIRLALSASRLRLAHGSVALATSFGVAERKSHSRLEDLISAADMELYAAKREGRNRVSSSWQHQHARPGYRSG